MAVRRTGYLSVGVVAVLSLLAGLLAAGAAQATNRTGGGG